MVGTGYGTVRVRMSGWHWLWIRAGTEVTFSVSARGILVTAVRLFQALVNVHAVRSVARVSLACVRVCVCVCACCVCMLCVCACASASSTRECPCSASRCQSIPSMCVCVCVCVRF